MKILLLVAHPDTMSFNHAIARAAEVELVKRGHDVVAHDLYAQEFPSNLPANEIPKVCDDLNPLVERHCQQVQEAEGFIVVHPNWWGAPPAILKGWVDRVLRPGVAYRFLEDDSGEGVPLGLLKAEKAIVFNTANTSVAREKRVFGDPLERIWRDCIFGLCGVDDVTRKVFSIIVTSTPQERARWLTEVREIVAGTFGSAY